MSYTVVKDDEFYSRQYENRLNAVVRHCRIGKVAPKVTPADVWSGIVTGPLLPKRDTFFVEPWPPVMDHPRNCVSTTIPGNA